MRNQLVRQSLFTSAICVASLFALSFSVTSTFAEDEKGRLGDGRAYRTDSDGNQIIDYIAELEIENETLKDRIRGLESEASSKQQAIERLRSAGSASPAVVERDLIPSEVRQPASVALVQERACPPQAACPTFTCPEFQCPVVEDHSTELQLLQAEAKNAKVDLELERRAHERTKSTVVTLESEAVRTASRVASLEAKVASVAVGATGAATTALAPRSCPVQDCGSEVSPIKQQLADTSAALQAVRLELQREQNAKSVQATEHAALRQQSERDLAIERAKVAQLEALTVELKQGQSNSAERSAQLIAQRETENEKLRAQIATLERDLSARQAELAVARSQAQPASGSSVAVALKQEDQSAQPAFKVKAEEDKPSWLGRVFSRDSDSTASVPAIEALGSQSVSPARSRAVESLRGGLNPEVNRIRDLYARRARLVAEAGQSGRQIKVAVQAAVSDRGIRAEELSTRVKSAGSAYELALLRRDIGEIRNILQEDIAVLERMRRGR